MKWDGKTNGELLSLMAKNSFELFVTIDASLSYQQNLKDYSIIIASIKAVSNDIEVLIPIAGRINKRAKNLKPGRIYHFE